MTIRQIKHILRNLANSRPLFHSESDFQFSLAWQIQSTFPGFSVRLEKPYPGVGAVDIEVKTRTKAYLIELKYKTERLNLSYNVEFFSLKKHNAKNINSYAVWKDVGRIQKTGKRGFVLFLTNDASYWKRPMKGAAAGCSLHHMRVLKPNSCISLNSKPSITLHRALTLNWDFYSHVHPHQKGFSKFKYLLIPV